MPQSVFGLVMVAMMQALMSEQHRHGRDMQLPSSLGKRLICASAAAARRTTVLQSTCAGPRMKSRACWQLLELRR